MSSGSSTTTHVENKYDDQWIRDWTGDAEGREKGYRDQLADLFSRSDSATRGREHLQGLIDQQNRSLTGVEGSLSDQQGLIQGLRGDLDEQERLTNYGLEGLRAAQIGLETATSGIDQRLAGQADQVDASLRLAQQGWANELAAAQAGWDTTQTAWQQQTADWTNQFSQQQRAAEAQLVTEREEYEDQLENIQDIFGQQSEAQRTAWEEQSAGQRAMFSDQLADLRARDAQEATQWEARFAQSQEQQRIADAIERRDTQASLNQLGTDFQAGLDRQRQEQRQEYQSLIDAASTDAEKARLQQAQQFEQSQQDQQAAWHMKSSELAAQDRVFGTQIGELRRDLGIETDLLGEAQRDFAQQSQLERGRLEQSIAGLGQSSAAARQELGAELTSQQQELQQDVTGQLGGFREDITDYKAGLAEQKQAQDEYYAANKRYREMQIKDAERARAAASYASAGTALNKQVKGVRRAGSSKPGGVIRSRSPRQSFNRSGLRISSLNI